MIGTVTKSLKRFFSKKKSNQKGIQYDIELDTYDLVSRPSISTSYWFPSSLVNGRINKIKKMENQIKELNGLAKKLRDLLETEEGEKSLERFAEKLEQKRKERLNYIETEEFQKTYKIIYDWVKKYERIDDTDIHYKFNPGINLESDEWNKFTDTIEENMRGNEIEDSESEFPKYHFEYKSINLYFMHGQGTVCWVTYNQRNDRDIKLNQII